MSKSRIGRRTVLRGMMGGVGIGVALPPMAAMFNGNGTAYADGAAIPTRMGIFFFGNGVKPDRWIPDQIGPNWTPSPSLKPLADAGVQDYVNVVSGTRITSGDQRGHHAGTAGILSGAPLISHPAGGAPYRSAFSKPRTDEVGKRCTGGPSPCRAWEPGSPTRVTPAEGTTLHYLSHTGPDSPLEPQYDPALVFNRVFGTNFTPPKPGTTPMADATLGYRKSVLDVVLNDMNKVRARSGTADKARLDKHADGIRSIENRLTLTTVPPPAACKVPGKPMSYPDQNGKEQIEPKMKAMSDILAIVLACNQTRIFSIMFSGSTASTAYWQVWVREGHHQLSHHEPG